MWWMRTEAQRQENGGKNCVKPSPPPIPFSSPPLSFVTLFFHFPKSQGGNKDGAHVNRVTLLPEDKQHRLLALPCLLCAAAEVRIGSLAGQCLVSHERHLCRVVMRQVSPCCMQLGGRRLLQVPPYGATMLSSGRVRRAADTALLVTCVSQ